MKKQFCTYEISKTLKELGFDEECLTYYSPSPSPPHNWNLQAIISTTVWDEESQNDSHKQNFTGYRNSVGLHFILKSVMASLWQQATAFFREEYNLDIVIKPWTGDIKGSKTYAGDITIFGTNKYIKCRREDSYYKAREQAILKVIELCKKK